jgi:hypothetical protein
VKTIKTLIMMASPRCPYCDFQTVTDDEIGPKSFPKYIKCGSGDTKLPCYYMRWEIQYAILQPVDVEDIVK